MLQVLLYADQVEYFEISELPRVTTRDPATALEESFLCSDFTVDLSLDTDNTGEA